MKTKYYVRVGSTDLDALEEHLTRSGTAFERLNHEFGKGNLTYVYSVNMDSEELTALKLSVPLIGCLNIHRAFSRLAPKV